jgi:lipopolysaccharide export system permease protein
MKIIDKYIIKKFLGTFFYCISLIIAISIVFDISEKIDDFINKKAPLSAIIFDYYLNFIPYFINLFSPLFVFISVIFFTAKMASQTEIVAILGSGISFRRMLFPYFIAATLLASLSFYLNGWVIPHSNEKRLSFENKYIRNPFVYRGRNVHRQIKPGEFIYIESYNNTENTGYQFSLEKIKDGKLNYKLMSENIRWDSISGKWRLENYFVRTIDGMNESLRSGNMLDTILPFKAAEFNRRITNIEAMDYHELNDFIKNEKMQGAENVEFYLIEKYRRAALPFSTFILTLIGVSLSSKKTRGGIGGQLGVGIMLSFGYILFMQVSYTFATNGNLPALFAVWMPNIFFAILSVFLIRRAPK